EGRGGGGGGGPPGGRAKPPGGGRRPCRSRSPACARPRRPNGRGRTGSCYRRYRRQGSYASRLPPVITLSYPTGCCVGKPELQFFPCCSCSIRPRQTEDRAGRDGQDQIGRDRRGLIEPRLAELAFDVS